MTEQPRRAFILGCQRSGTTLMRLILGAHPAVECLDEARAYAELLGTGPADDPDERLRVYKVPRLTEQMLEGAISDPLYGRSPSFYQREPLVFMLRSPEDVVASMSVLRDTADQVTWLERYARGIVEHKAQDPAFRERYADDLALLEARPDAIHLLGAFYWKYKSEALFDYQEAGLPVAGFAYERLVADPRPRLERLAAHLGLPWDDAMLRHHETTHSELDAQGFAIGRTDPRKPISRDAVGRAERVLSPEARAEIEAYVGDVWRRAQAAAW